MGFSCSKHYTAGRKTGFQGLDLQLGQLNSSKMPDGDLFVLS